MAPDALSQNPTSGSLEGDTAVDESQVVTVKSISPTIDQVLKLQPAATSAITYQKSR